MRDPLEVYNNTLVPMVVEQTSRASRSTAAKAPRDLIVVGLARLPRVASDDVASEEVQAYLLKILTNTHSPFLARPLR